MPQRLLISLLGLSEMYVNISHKYIGTHTEAAYINRESSLARWHFSWERIHVNVSVAMMVMLADRWFLLRLSLANVNTQELFKRMC